MTRKFWSVAATFLVFFGSVAAALQTTGPVQYVYDRLGRLVGVIDAGGNAAVYSYDAVGNILSISRYTSAQVSVISFTPEQGGVGASVTIYGTGFSTTAAQNSIQFNGVAATVVSASLNQLTASVPAGATTGPITVSTPAGSATSSSNFTVSAEAAPLITDFSPVVGAPGDPVTINGSNFETNTLNNRVRFNLAPGIPGSATATSISTTVPSGATSGHISVATPAGSAISSQDFYVPFGTHVAADVAYTGRIAVGGSATVTLSTPGKIGLVLFEGTQGQRLNLQWVSTISNCGLYVLAPNGSQITYAPCGGASGGIDSMLLTSSGTYTLGVVAAGTSGSLTVNLADVSDATASIIIDGPAVTATTTKAGQDARLIFSGTAGQRVVLQVTNVSAGQSATVHLVGVTGESTSALFNISGSTPGQVFFMDTQPLVATGRYTLWVQHSGTNIGSETLQLNSVPPDFTAPITVGGAAVRVPATGNTALGQNASLTFSASAGQKVSLNLSNSTYPSSTDCLLMLEDPNGTNVLSGYCGSGANSLLDTVTLNAAGNYTVFIDPQGMATGTVTVQLNDDSDVTGTISVDGSAVTATTTHAGQDARLTFSGTAGQRVVLRVSAVSNPSATVNLVKPDGTTQTSISVNNNPAGQTFFIDTQTLATTGTYTLWVQHSGTNIGSETLQLNSVPPDFTAP
ncbi:MAG: IPT/TIG domain-containing protein, partial [Acidobacteriia bacterium]|nr:IPT/TIG domain-containing protein [Terriglobia bacterium]